MAGLEQSAIASAHDSGLEPGDGARAANLPALAKARTCAAKWASATINGRGRRHRHGLPSGGKDSHTLLDMLLSLASRP
jgi:hypothetical protein